MIEIGSLESPHTVGSHYDDLDEFYREIWGLHVHHGLWESGKETSDEATLALVQHMVKDLALNSESEICDVGCGYGASARYLAATRGSRVTALSVSEKQVSFARKHTEGLPVKILKRDWMKNRLPSNHFDLVYSIESTEHMPDLRKFFTEARRVLKPGGSLRVYAWLSAEAPQNWAQERLLEPICEEGRMRLGKESEYRAIMEESGFSDVGFEDLSGKVDRTWTLCLERCALKFLTDPKYISFLLKSPSQNKAFLLSLFRIRLAYAVKAMRYGLFSGNLKDS